MNAGNFKQLSTSVTLSSRIKLMTSAVIRITKQEMRFQVPTAANMKMAIFWVVAP
jgi:hypothetical protein